MNNKKLGLWSLSINKRYVAPAMVLAMLALFLSPMILRKFYSTHQSEYPLLFKIVLICIPLAAGYFSWKKDLKLPESCKKASLFLFAALSLLLVDIHLLYIDGSSRFACRYWDNMDNAEWQLDLHKKILSLDPDALPHLYRFLPDSIVELFTFLTNDFDFSKLIYRETCMYLLICAIYYYGRLYHNHIVAVISVLIYAVTYQISIRYYAGQLTDPLSHLSFILAFIFIELDLFLYFSMAVILGIMAKETILIMPIYYLLFKRGGKGHYSRILPLLATSILLTVAIRILIIHPFKYEHISGAGTLEHMAINISDIFYWWPQVFYTVGILLPFAILSWRSVPRQIQSLILFLFPTLLCSNLVFSYLVESRNLMPLVFPLALVTANCLYDHVQRATSA